MSDENLHLVLNEDQARYLASREWLPGELQRRFGPQQSRNSPFVMSLAERRALLDALGSALQRIGFTADYGVTDEGSMIEEIIDALSP
jgi:hypothetical protein